MNKNVYSLILLVVGVIIGSLGTYIVISEIEKSVDEVNIGSNEEEIKIDDIVELGYEEDVDEDINVVITKTEEQLTLLKEKKESCENTCVREKENCAYECPKILKDEKYPNCYLYCVNITQFCNRDCKAKYYEEIDKL